MSDLNKSELPNLVFNEDHFAINLGEDLLVRIDGRNILWGNLGKVKFPEDYRQYAEATIFAP